MEKRIKSALRCVTSPVKATSGARNSWPRLLLFFLTFIEKIVIIFKHNFFTFNSYIYIIADIRKHSHP